MLVVSHSTLRIFAFFFSGVNCFRPTYVVSFVVFCNCSVSTFCPLKYCFFYVICFCAILAHSTFMYLPEPASSICKLSNCILHHNHLSTQYSNQPNSTRSAFSSYALYVEVNCKTKCGQFVDIIMPL